MILTQKLLDAVRLQHFLVPTRSYSLSGRISIDVGKNEVNRSKDAASIERRACEAFLDGLDDAIRYNVKDKNPQTCQAAFDEALRQDMLKEDRDAANSQLAPTIALLDEMRSLNENWRNNQRKEQPEG
uniref:Uncharacterized protein n=2 Tax=Caenorhabditis japonica TaxID=281687 RepID=A0A8R1IK85_CAEJA